MLSSLLAILLCGTVHADLVYEYYNYGSHGLTSITQNGSDFSQGQSISLGSDVEDPQIFSFTHNGHPRLLVASMEGNLYDYDDSFSSYANSFTLSVYDPADLSSPLVKKNMGSSGIGLIGVSNVAEFRNNIIVAGISFQSAALVEINPDTLDVVSTYKHFGISDFQDDSFAIFLSAAANYNGTIYAAFIHQVTDFTGNSESYNDRVDFVTMSSLGNVTSRHNNFSMPNSFAGAAFSGGSLYAGIGEVSYYRTDDANKYGIYRVKSINPDEAVRVLEGDIGFLCSDGNGGLYYTLNEEDSSSYGGTSYYASGISRTVYHWNGSSSEQVYQSDGSYSYIDDIQYDTASNTLFILLHDKIMALNNGSVSQVAAFQAGAVDYFTVLGASPYTTGNSSTPSTPSTPSTQSGNDTPAAELPSGVIEPPVITSSDVLDNIAALVSTDASHLHLITQENISSPSEPTQTMREYIKNDGYEAAYKFNTLTVSEDGYYVFLVNIPDELVGKSVNDIRLYALKNADFASSFYSLINGILNYGEITNLFGVKIDTLEKQVLAVGFLQAGTPFSVYLAKIIVALLAGGCSLAGAGITVLLLAGMFFRRR